MRPMTVTEFLGTAVPFLAGLTAEQYKILAQAVDQQVYNKGQTVLFKGVTVDGLYVLAQGKVSIHVKPEKNKDWVQVAELGSGEVFGETSIVEMTTAGATVKGAEDQTLIFMIPQECFRDILAANPEFLARVQQVIDSRKAKPAAPPPA